MNGVTVNIVTNTSLARRRRRQAALLSFGGFLVLLVGLGINLLAVRDGAAARGGLAAAYIALLAGSVMSWLGMGLSDRWAIPPRPDEALGAALKGAGPAFRLYHWVLPADHVLLAPWGFVVFAVFNHEGPLTVRGTRWRDARPLWRRVLALGRRPVRDPTRWLAVEVNALRRALAENDEHLGETPVGTVPCSRTRASRSPWRRRACLPCGRTRCATGSRAAGKQPALPTPKRRRLERASRHSPRSALPASGRRRRGAAERPPYSAPKGSGVHEQQQQRQRRHAEDPSARPRSASGG